MTRLEPKLVEKPWGRTELPAMFGPTAGRRIGGMQGQLWSETIRNSQIADYMLFPRTLALAERAWHKAAWEPDYVAGKSYAFADGSVDTKSLLADWNDFQARLLPRLAELDQVNIPYRLPVPGARMTTRAAGRRVSRRHARSLGPSRTRRRARRCRRRARPR